MRDSCLMLAMGVRAGVLALGTLSFASAAFADEPVPGVAETGSTETGAGEAVDTSGPSFDSWVPQSTEPYRGKQDDIVFISPEVGYYGNGAGKVFKTIDGGENWAVVLDKPGLFVRCLGFLDEDTGFIGNVGPGYFPGVEDETLMYRTDDGGASWKAVPGLDGSGLAGLCAIQVVRYPFIDAGVAGEKALIVAGGRVGGPAGLLMSSDQGETWEPIDLSAHGGMVLDVHFFTDRIGLVATSTSSDIQESRARIIRTEDGGATWQVVYESARPFELTWKFSFPTRQTGYCTVQSYNPDPAASQRFVAKTADGGRSWAEIPLVDDARVRAFGVGFIDERTGFVGAVPGGFLTTDGGATWSPAGFGPAVNKIRVLKIDDGTDVGPDRFVAFAIGVQVHRLDGTLDEGPED